MMNIDKNTGISIGLAIAIFAGALYVGSMDARIDGNTRSNVAQWKRISAMESIATDVAEIRGQVGVIYEKLLP